MAEGDVVGIAVAPGFALTFELLELSGVLCHFLVQNPGLFLSVNGP